MVNVFHYELQSSASSLILQNENEYVYSTFSNKRNKQYNIPIFVSRLVEKINIMEGF